ncbi:Peptidase family M23 [compost metagenome]
MTEIVTASAVLILIVLLHLHLWRRLVFRVSAVGSVWRIIGSVISACSWAIITLALVSGPYGAPLAVLDPVAYAGKAWLGPFLIGAGAVLITDVWRLFTKNKGHQKALKQEGSSLPNKAVRVRIIIFFALAVVGTVVNISLNEGSAPTRVWNAGVIGSLPFTGRWLVGSTPAQKVPSHGTDMFGVGYAIDFIAVDEQNRTSPTTSWRTLLSTEPPEIFYAFGQPVLSPVSGTVVSVHDGEPDHEARRSMLTLLPYMLGQNSRIRSGPEAIAGNYTIIAPDDSTDFIAIVHLQLGSIRVAQGQRVSEGEHLANCGNSGNSTQPHIHIQAMSSTDLSVARGVPLIFRRFSEWGPGSNDPRVRESAIPDTKSVISP